jgi:prepilin-type N-terminal cleavage/methylation domain-containing protein
MTGTKRAFTLVEILTALAILVMVLGAVFVLYQTAVRASQRVEQPTSAAAETGIARLLRDLACAVCPEDDEACRFRLENEPASSESAPSAWRLTFCAATPFENPAAPRWYGIESVVYRWAAAQPALIRASAPIAGGVTPSATNVVAEHVDGLALSLFDGETWRSSWATGSLPRAARLIWRENGQSFTAETYVAAGLTFTSAVRQASP